jgi:hypothetical protein
MTPEQRIEALRLAKLLPVLSAGEYQQALIDAADLLRTLAATEPQGEPVAWLYTKAETNQFACVVKRMNPTLDGAKEWLETPLYLHPAPAQTPLTEWVGKLVDSEGVWDAYVAKPVTPPATESDPATPDA